MSQKNQTKITAEPGKQEIFIPREFEASRELVFKAFTDPNGNEFGFHGVVHDVTAPERIIQTFEFEGLPEKGHVILETSKFEALPGNRTKITIQSVFQSVADRDGMLMSGMERGVNDSHNRLDEFFENLPAGKAGMQ
jgi:uncharacterized protein YndB with AHSA1/START domain